MDAESCFVPKCCYLCTALTEKRYMVPVVQLVRASDCGSECRGFESHRAPQKKKEDIRPLFSLGASGGTPVPSFSLLTQPRSLSSLSGPPGPHSRSKHSLAPIR